MTSSQSITELWRSIPEHKAKVAKPLHQAVYSAAIAMSDDEIRVIVADALIRARRDLSS